LTISYTDDYDDDELTIRESVELGGDAAEDNR